MNSLEEALAVINDVESGASTVGYRVKLNTEQKIIKLLVGEVIELRKLIGAKRKKKERHADDFYRTPDWCADVGAKILRLPSGTHVVDPCAGDGALLDAIERNHSLISVGGFDINPRREDVCGVDALEIGKWTNSHKWVTFMNPPFVHAQAFLERSFAEGASETLALLRLGFLATKKRKTFFAKHGQPDVHVLEQRPSFTEDGQTDGSEYAWFHWWPGMTGTVIRR